MNKSETNDAAAAAGKKSESEIERERQKNWLIGERIRCWETSTRVLGNDQDLGRCVDE